MNRSILIYVCGIISIFASSCSSQESKAKEVVKSFCEAYSAGQTDKAISMYPAFTKGIAKIEQIDLENLNAIRQDDKLRVDDGANHIFYLEESDGKLIITNSNNFIGWESESRFDKDAAILLGMVNDESLDIDRIKAFSNLKDGSDLVEFLKNKYPNALVYNVVVDNVRKENVRIIKCMEVKATVKSGPITPLGPLNCVFIFKDKDGNEIMRKTSVTNLHSANSTDVNDSFIFYSDYPNVKDVSVELERMGKKLASDIDLLYLYAPLNQHDYQEYLNTQNN